MNVALISPEAVPYIKTGGLADVVGALFTGLKLKGHDVSLFLPLYRRIREELNPSKVASGMKLSMGDRIYYYDLYVEGDTYFISNDFFYDRDGIYGDRRGDFRDNAQRFAFFCKAVLEALKPLGISPEIFHLHDWQTGLIPFYQKETGMASRDIKSVFTIHNLGYQGLFSPDVLSEIGISRKFLSMEGLEFYGKISLLKSGVLYADIVTTVSNNYQKEITTTDLGYGFEGLLKKKGITGILNGIDYAIWNPAHDTSIRKTFDCNDLAGKSLCKRDLCRMFSLVIPSAPLIGVIGRFSAQKGYDIIAESVDELVALGFNIVILGKGERLVEQTLSKSAARHPGRVGLIIGFDENLARKIYAGSDMFLMPSRYEPCGVAQMIAMRYGSVPIVRLTGGLIDTVTDYNPSNKQGTGFTFYHPDRHSMIDCMKRTLCFFRSRNDWKAVRRNAMRATFSWSDAIDKYVALYASLAGGSKKNVFTI